MSQQGRLGCFVAEVLFAGLVIMVPASFLAAMGFDARDMEREAVCRTAANEVKANGSGGITFNAGGRFGDQLIALSHALWVSLKTDRPLIVRRFPYLEELVASRMWPQFTHWMRPQVTRWVYREGLGVPSSLTSRLLQIEYFPDPIWEASKSEWAGRYFAVDWDEPVFRSLMKRAVTLRKPIQFPEQPHGCLSVALHWRTGGTFDGCAVAVDQRMKMPDPQFFIDALHLVQDLRPGEPLYVYLFTDHVDPNELADMLRAQCDDTDVMFDFRLIGNRDDLNVTRDFFHMQTFDVLIRSDSNYSLLCGRLVDYQLEIYPLACTSPGQDPAPHVTRIGYSLGPTAPPLDSSIQLRPERYVNEIEPKGRWARQLPVGEEDKRPAIDGQRRNEG
ncbi:MAG: hypothetical protein ACOYKZ_07405 [Chlamydiia bacterium]